MSEQRVPIPGSERPVAPAARTAGARPVDRDARVKATVVLRRRAPLEQPQTGATPLTPAELAERHGATEEDVAQVRTTLGDAGVEILDVDAGARRIRIAASVSTMEQFFQTELAAPAEPAPAETASAETDVRRRSGPLSVPVELDGIVTAVLGLDNRPQANTRSRVAAARAQTQSYTPVELSTVYAMPEGTDGSGQTVAIVELGGGFAQSDLDTYFGGLGLTSPKVTAVGVDGASNVAGQDPDGADGEVLLDIEVVGGVAPKSDIVVYFAPNTDAGFLDAITTAAQASPTPAAISISWGQSEDEWTEQARTAMDDAFADATALGITVTAAAGDSGSSDSPNSGASGGSSGSGEVHVDFPASSPHALACGGTRLEADPSTGVVTSETVWNDGASGGSTGGGVSDTFEVPSWQTNAGVPARSDGGTGRGVPDIAAVADPQTGYEIYVDGQSLVIGGTSAVAPLWAGLVARLVQSLGRPLGLLQPALYASAQPAVSADGLRDITEGNNGAYQAGPGWDPCTGLGVPNGTELLSVLQQQAITD